MWHYGLGQASKVSVAKAMESLVKLLHEEHALVQGQAKQWITLAPYVTHMSVQDIKDLIKDVLHNKDFHPDGVYDNMHKILYIISYMISYST